MLKAILTLLFVILHEWPNFFEVTLYETGDYCIFIFIYPVSIKVFILCKNVFNLILYAEISIVRQLGSPYSHVIKVIFVFEVELCHIFLHKFHETKLAIKFNKPLRNSFGFIIEVRLRMLKHRNHDEVDRIEHRPVEQFSFVTQLCGYNQNIFSILQVNIIH